jgi:enamine deaminase RidA (YjgF/YER057c/UK114 family)
MTAITVHGEIGAPRSDRERSYTFSHAFRSGRLVHVSGMLAIDERGRLLADDLAGQTRVIYRRLGELLDELDATPAQVVKTTDYITTTDGYRETADIRREFFGSHRPASTGVVVAGLLHAQAVIEIDAVVVLDSTDVAVSEISTREGP